MTEKQLIDVRELFFKNIATSDKISKMFDADQVTTIDGIISCLSVACSVQIFSKEDLLKITEIMYDLTHPTDVKIPSRIPASKPN